MKVLLKDFGGKTIHFDSYLKAKYKLFAEKTNAVICTWNMTNYEKKNTLPVLFKKETKNAA